MTLSILQLNTNADNFWDNLVSFLTEKQFDILHLQEVSGKDTIAGNIDAKIDCYEELQKVLGDSYHSEIAISQRYTSSPTAYMANVTFFKKEFTLIEKKIVTLHERSTPFPSDATGYEDVGRNVLHLTLQINDKKISFLNTHLAWAKTTKEQPHQSKQGEILLDYLQTVPHPFVFTGDFNLDTEQSIIRKTTALAKNLIDEYHIVNTLNPRTHSAQILFPPGAAVDYIFVTPDIKVNTFKVVEQIDLSDHLGLTAEIEI